MAWPPPDVQTYTRMLSILSRAAASDPPDELRRGPAAAAATALLDDAVAQFGPDRLGGAAAAPLLNAALRGCAEVHDTGAALALWRGPVKQLLARTKPRHRAKVSAAAYHGLVYCMGLAGRPDYALRVVYAMKKSGVCNDNDNGAALPLAEEQATATSGEVQMGPRTFA